jgi:hypothetical protein
MTNPTASDVAAWMLAELDRVNQLYQDEAAHRILQLFGKDFVYINQNGNWAINRNALSEFKKLTGDTVVWERGTRSWRKRASYDKKGRQQD